MRRSFAVAAIVALAAGCGQRSGTTVPPVAGTPTGTARGTSLRIVVSTGSATNARSRRTAAVPTGTVSVAAAISTLASGSSAVTTACANVPAGATSVSFTISAPQGLSFLTIGAYTGPCAAGGTATGTLLAAFTGTGTVTPTSTDAAAVYNGGQPFFVSSKVLPPLPDYVPTVVWSEIGPTQGASFGWGGAGKLQSFIRHPQQPNTMWIAGGYGAGFEVGTQAGIFKSTNGGATWVRADGGLTDTTVDALWISADGSVLLAATWFTGIFRSLDGGTTWSKVVDTSATCLVTAADGSVYACGVEGVYHSHDGGASWTLDFATSRAVDAVNVSGQRVFAGRRPARRRAHERRVVVRRYRDAGRFWHPLPPLRAHAKRAVRNGGRRYDVRPLCVRDAGAFEIDRRRHDVDTRRAAGRRSGGPDAGGERSVARNDLHR